MDLGKIKSLIESRKVDLALHELDLRLKENPCCEPTLRCRARVLFLMRRYHDVLEEFQKLIGLCKEPIIADYYYLGEANLRLGRYAIAEEHFRDAIRLSVEQGDAWLEDPSRFLLAIVLLRLGRLEEAKEIARALPEDYVSYGDNRVWRRDEILNYEPGMELPNVCPIFRPARGET